MRPILLTEAIATGVRNIAVGITLPSACRAGGPGAFAFLAPIQLANLGHA